jgi:hypothetical protein
MCEDADGVAFGFFLKEINEILGPSSRVIYLVDQACP